MSLETAVIDAIIKRWGNNLEPISFFARGSWHSFEEWLNWEAAMGCRDNGLPGVWPKAPYSYKNQDPPPKDRINVNNEKTSQYLDLLVEDKNERVVIEVKLVHGNSTKRMKESLDADITKLKHAKIVEDKTITALQIVVTAFHKNNKAGPSKSKIPDWFNDWVKEREQENLNERVSISNDTHPLPEGDGGELKVYVWRISPHQ